MYEIASGRYRDLTSPTLLNSRDRLVASEGELTRLEQDRRALEAESQRLEKRRRRAGTWLGRLLRIDPDAVEDEQRDVMFRRVEADEQAEALRRETRWEFNDAHLAWHRHVGTAFDLLIQSHRVWDVTHAGGEVHYKSGAGHSVERCPVHLHRSRLPQVNPDLDTFCFGNANGPDLHLLPGLIALTGRSNLALIRFADCEFDIRAIRFHEDERVPPDAMIAEYTWTHVNKDGSPDRRFNPNPQIPVCLYGQITIESTTGLYERYMVSNGNAVVAFTEALQDAPKIAAEHEKP
jgi:hypothetical protein